MVDDGVRTTPRKNLKTTLPRIENFYTSDRFRDSNLVGRLYPKTTSVNLYHWALPLGTVGEWEDYPFERVITEANDEWDASADVGCSYGPTWSTHWFKVEFTVPEDWEGEEVRFRWGSGSEATIWGSDGLIKQGLSTGTERTYRPDYIVHESYQVPEGGPVVETIYLEMVCGQQNGAADGDEIDPPDPDKYYTITKAEISVLDRNTYKLTRDLEVLYKMAATMINKYDDHRGYTAMYTANQMINHIIAGDDQAASDVAQTFFSMGGGERTHILSTISHCHIDCGWLWPYTETKRKVSRSFANVLELLGRGFTEMNFAASQAQLFYWCKEKFDDLYSQVVTKVSEGSFIPVGGVWVELDGNIPSGESFIRQFIYGQKFFFEEFGIKCKEFWLPDTFGYNGHIPGMMNHVGITRFMSKKMSWNLVNEFPHHNFIWEGIDGSTVLAHFPPVSYSEVVPEDMLEAIAVLNDKGRVSTSLYMYGYGDGGGGPTEEQLQRARRLADVDGLPKIVHSTPDSLFSQLETEKKDMLTWVGELYLELHNGTYTSHAEMKKYNRQSELKLREAEFMLVCACATLGTSAEQLFTESVDKLEVAWKKVLLNQFHDVLPGTGIELLYLGAVAYAQEALQSADEVWNSSIAELFGTGAPTTKVVFNTLQWDRTEVVDDQGIQQLVNVGPFSYAVLEMTAPSYPVTLIYDDVNGIYTLDNGILKVEIEEVSGAVMSLQLISNSRDFLRQNGVQNYGNQIVMYDDEPIYWDAWDVNDYHLETGNVLNKPGVSSSTITPVSIVGAPGNFSTTLSWSLQISEDSTMTQNIIMKADTPYIIFANTVTWNESRKILKTEINTNLLSRNATYDIQFGQVERATHLNTTWDTARYEVCGHKWASLYETDTGVAVLNDCKYGWNAEGSSLALSLLRSPKAPDPNCDMTTHSFSYAYFPFEGSLQEGQVVRRAHEFNNPLRIEELPSATVLSNPNSSLFKVNGEGIMLNTIKPPTDIDQVTASPTTDFILRFYEYNGCQSQATIEIGLPVTRIQWCNGLEANEADAPFNSDAGVSSFIISLTPFQIKAARVSL